MSKLNSPSCDRFYQVVNQEIACGQFMHDHLTKNALQNNFITPEGKRFFGIPERVPLTMYEVTRTALDALPKMRFIYLLSLLEAFVKEYIAERDGVAVDDVSSHIGAEESSWQKAGNKSTGNKSTSLYDVGFVNHVLVSRYEINLSSLIQPVTFEVGALRNCLVHHQGVIVNNHLRVRLKADGATIKAMIQT